jgi:hypothetical protein
MAVLSEKLGLPVFERQMVAHLRSIHPDRFRSLLDDDLRMLILRVVDKCRHIGITDYPACGVVLELVIEFGEDFFEVQPWVQAALRNAAWSNSDGRDGLLLDAAVKHLEEEAARAAASGTQAETAELGEE